MITCDLPYSVTQNIWDSVIDLPSLWVQYIRVIKKSGVIVLTSQGRFTGKLIESNATWFKYKMVWIKSKSTNFLNANTQLNRLGFDGAKADVDRNMKVGNRDFSVPISHFVNETERVEYKLHYTRTDGNGYDLARFDAKYIAGNNQPIVSSFNSGDIDAKQAFNLLAGRSVEKPDGSWIQLDFTDKDAEGNFKTKVFPASLGYDINLAIEKLKNSTGIGLAHIQGMVMALKNEETKQVLEVVANPLKKEITIYADGLKHNYQQQQSKSVSQKGPEQSVEKEVVTKGKSRG